MPCYYHLQCLTSGNNELLSETAQLSTLGLRRPLINIWTRGTRETAVGRTGEHSGIQMLVKFVQMLVKFVWFVIIMIYLMSSHHLPNYIYIYVLVS